jgi:uncharacterized protein with NRDE domain
MCLIVFAIEASARWPLLIAANRDEFLDRPTLALTRWRTDTGSEVISGRDLRAGGTWLGVNPAGRIAMLTNVREASPKTGEKSRGDLALRWLEGGMDAAEFMAQTDSAAYGPFNLVLGDFQANAWHWLSNRGVAGNPEAAAATKGWYARALMPGIYSLSNGTLDAPWPKSRRLDGAVRTALAAPDQDSLLAQLWAALQDRQRADTDDLPNTGVSLALEQALSSVFVDYPEYAYGTRCSTVLLASAQEKSPKANHWGVQISEKIHVRPGPSATQATPQPAAQNCHLNWQRGVAAPT